MKQNLKGLTISELQELMEQIGEKKYRARQLFQWINQKNSDEFEDMSNISKEFRNKLNENYVINKLNLLEFRVSHDKTTKFLFELEDKNRIESVLIPPISVNRQENWIDEKEVNRLTICLSTQVGCPLGCVFCATGYMKFRRNLTVFEIIDQILRIQKQSEQKITNIVFMGMGEPLLNYENVSKAIEIINHDLGMNMAQRHMTVSTSGIIPGIKKVADEKKKFRLAISLHSLNNDIRSKIMPINKKYPLNELIESIKYYYRMTGLRPTFEFILFDKLNDSDDDVKRIISLSKQIPCKFNFIHFHNSPLFKTGITGSSRFSKFVEKLRDANLTVLVRNSSGEDIAAACGQLAVLIN